MRKTTAPCFPRELFAPCAAAPGWEGGKESPVHPAAPRQSGAGGAGRGRARPSGSAAGAEPARPRERSRSCRGAMALLPRRFLCFVLGKCGRRDTTSLEPLGRGSTGLPSPWGPPCSLGRLLRAAPALPEARPGSCLAPLAT